MIQATFVLFATRAQLGGLRALVGSMGDDTVRWRERRKLFGSEFYLGGPTAQAREVHARAASYLSRPDWPG